MKDSNAATDKITSLETERESSWTKGVIRRTGHLIHGIREAALREDPHAIPALYEIATQAIEALRSLAPKQLVPFAKTVNLWPVLTGRDMPSLSKSLAVLLEQIDLASDTSFEGSIDPNRLSKNGTKIKDLVSELFQFVAEYRAFIEHRGFYQKAVRSHVGHNDLENHRSNVIQRARILHARQERLIDILQLDRQSVERLPLEIRRDIALLGNISPATFSAWFSVISKVLVWLTNNRFEDASFGLRRWGESRHKQKGEKAEQKTYFRDGILQSMNQALRGLVRIPHPKTKK